MAPWSGLWGGRAVLAGGDAYRGTPVVVRMENPNSWSISEINDDDDDDYGGGQRRRRRRRRGKNAKQITWVLLLNAHRAAGCLAWLASAAVALGCAARRRVAAGRTDADDGAPAPAPTPTPPPTPRRSRLYAFIRALLLLSLFLLAAELAAHANGRRLAAAAVSLGSLHASWVRFRAAYVAPPLQRLADACVALFLVQSADRVAQCLGCLYIRLRRVRPEPVSPPAVPDAEDPDAGYFPMVLVQIPMCNEKEVKTAAFSPLAFAIPPEKS